MRKFDLSRMDFTILIVVANFIFYAVGMAILRYVHDEGWANAASVYLGVLSVAIINYLNSESALQVRTIIGYIAPELDKPFFILMIAITQASSQLISSILPQYIHNNILLIALQIFIPIVTTAIVTYMSSEEPQKIAKKSEFHPVWEWWVTFFALVIVVLMLILFIVLAVRVPMVISAFGPIQWIEVAMILLMAGLTAMLVYLVWLYFKIHAKSKSSMNP